MIDIRLKLIISSFNFFDKNFFRVKVMNNMPTMKYTIIDTILYGLFIENKRIFFWI